MSVTDKPDDRIPHGLRGYRAPYNHRCSVCKAANAEYMRGKRAEYAAAKRDDELAAKRAQRSGKGPAISTKGSRAAAARRSESNDSDSKARKGIGDMERAVIAECESLPRAKDRPTLVIAARNLAKIVDTPDMSSIHTSTTKQIMAILADLHGDTEKKKATGKRKSGGRLATVGALTKVNRAQ